MYSVGDTIIYTTYGICKIVDQIQREFNGQLKNYYILRPIHDPKASLQVQVDNPLTNEKIKVLLTKDEIYSLIGTIPTLKSYWIENENERKKQFSSILRSGERCEIIRIIRSIYDHQIELKERGRKLHACDEQYFKDAQKMIDEELNYVLENNPKSILDYIIDELEYAN